VCLLKSPPLAPRFHSYLGIATPLNLSIMKIYVPLCEEKVSIGCSIMRIYALLCGEKVSKVGIDWPTNCCMLHQKRGSRWTRTSPLDVDLVFWCKMLPEVRVLKSSTTIMFGTERDPRVAFVEVWHPSLTWNAASMFVKGREVRFRVETRPSYLVWSSRLRLSLSNF